MAFDEKTIRDIFRRLENLETRIKTLESHLQPTSKPAKPISTEEYKGLSGGIKLMINNGFFNGPRTVIEVQGELERLGYYHAKGAIDTALRRDFMKRNQILTRVSKDGKWQYVVKK